MPISGSYERSRILRGGGALCIVPLYFHGRYTILTDPAMLPQPAIAFEPDAVVGCLKQYHCRHGRLYDVDHFMSRVHANLSGLSLTIFAFQNSDDVDPSCTGVEFAALLRKD